MKTRRQGSIESDKGGDVSPCLLGRETQDPSVEKVARIRNTVSLDRSIYAIDWQINDGTGLRFACFVVSSHHRSTTRPVIGSLWERPRSRKEIDRWWSNDRSDRVRSRIVAWWVPSEECRVGSLLSVIVGSYARCSYCGISCSSHASSKPRQEYASWPAASAPSRRTDGLTSSASSPKNRWMQGPPLRP